MGIRKEGFNFIYRESIEKYRSLFHITYFSLSCVERSLRPSDLIDKQVLERSLELTHIFASRSKSCKIDFEDPGYMWS